MISIKILITCVFVSLLSACGTGEFFIKRAVNNLQDDVAKEFKRYADFDPEQEQQIDYIAQKVDSWARTNRLPVLYGELEKMAQDIESSSQISDATWSSTVSFLESPLNLREQDGVVESIAETVFSMTEVQASQAIEKMQKDYVKTLKEQKKVTLESQNKKLVRGFKIVFSELGIKRSKAQIAQARTMLAQRKSHIDLDNQASERDHNTFLGLVAGRQMERADYIEKFGQAWKTAEQGAKHQAPELWDHNAQVAFDVVNYLLEDLSQEQRQTAARKIRDYADLFKELANG